MTATLLEARQALRSVLLEVDGIDTVYDYRHASPTPPCAMVGWPDVWTPELYLGGGHSWSATIPVIVLVALGTNDAADRNLSGLMEPSGASSISATLYEDSTLGGTVASVALVNVTDIGVVQSADEGIQYLSATFNVEVYSG